MSWKFQINIFITKWEIVLLMQKLSNQIIAFFIGSAFSMKEKGPKLPSWKLNISAVDEDILINKVSFYLTFQASSCHQHRNGTSWKWIFYQRRYSFASLAMMRHKLATIMLNGCIITNVSISMLPTTTEVTIDSFVVVCHNFFFFSTYPIWIF